jgi:serine protease Do
MKYILTAVFAMLLAGCQMTTTQIVDKNRDGVVLIANELEGDKGGIGTGFLIQDNMIVTNHHVIEGNGKLSVFADDSERKYDAKVLYSDEIADLAIVVLEDWDKFKETETPEILSFGDSENIVPGDKVIVIGHPWGLAWTVSEGIMSAKNIRMGQNPKFMDQIDAKIFQGNSGGPTFNDKGEVVCVNDMMLAKEGGSYGFCLPSNFVKKVLYDLDKFGEVRWRAINVSVNLTDDRSSVILASVEPNGAADKAGLKEGDKLLEIYTPNNHPNGVEISNADDLISEFAVMRGDDEDIKLLIERNGEKMMIDVKTNYKLSKEYTPDMGKK